MNQIDLAIKCFKTIKDSCDRWGSDMDKLKMKTYEQIAVCYRTRNKFNTAIEYFKKALQYAYYTNDHLAEVRYYERLAFAYMDVSSPLKMNKYYDRAMHNILEGERGPLRVGATMWIALKKK